ncbi:uncharacterized protein [Rhodnius prolixus]|uniref:uncharacterized protein n=1 Tax=Rhodnius prolixus TaxID=13249 RepID=UPI003D18C432
MGGCNTNTTKHRNTERTIPTTRPHIPTNNQSSMEPTVVTSDSDIDTTNPIHRYTAIIHDPEYRKPRISGRAPTFIYINHGDHIHIIYTATTHNQQRTSDRILKFLNATPTGITEYHITRQRIRNWRNFLAYPLPIVQAQVEVLFPTQDGAVDLALDEINIPTLHAKCRYGSLICLSEAAGHIAWDKTSELQSCEEKEYEVIYEGQAHIESKNNGLRIINVSDKKNIFSLVIKEDVRICNQMGFATEHNRLFIVFVNNNNYFFKYRSNNALNVDLIAYINTKIVYVERYIGEKLTSLYDDILQQRCLSQASIPILSNLLALAYTSEDEFAYAYKKEPGYTALTRGEVIHLIKCVPVEVNVVETDTCYTEAAVKYRNTTIRRDYSGAAVQIDTRSCGGPAA